MSWWKGVLLLHMTTTMEGFAQRYVATGRSPSIELARAAVLIQCADQWRGSEVYGAAMAALRSHGVTMCAR